MKKEPFDVEQPFSSGFLLCGDPTFLWSDAELRELEKELLTLDQRDPNVPEALVEVRRVMKEKEST